MTAETKTSVASRFTTYAFPTATDFATLVSSYANFSDALEAIASAAAAGSKGLVYVSGASAVTFYSAASQGLRIANTATTAAAVSILGAGTAGAGVFAAATTAAAQQSLAGGTVGRALFETATTAAAIGILGSSVSAATQAETEGASAQTVYISPERARDLPMIPKAWAYVSAGNPSETKASYNIASITSAAAGVFSLVFSRAMSSDAFAVLVGTQLAPTVAQIVGFQSTAATVSAGGTGLLFLNGAGSNATPVRFSVTILGDH